MQPQQAVEALAEVDRIRRRTQATLHTFWFPLVLWGALMLTSVPVVAVLAGPSIGVYWALAGPLGGIVTGWYYQRRERQLGVESRPGPYVAGMLGIMVGAFAAGFGGGALGLEMVAAVGPLVWISVAWLWFAWLERSLLLAGEAAGLAALAIGLWVAGADPQQASLVGTVAYGTVFLLTGLAYGLAARIQR
jgi:hypothetical protein